MTAYNITTAQTSRLTLVSGDTVTVAAAGSLSVASNAQAIRMTAANAANNVSITNNNLIEDTNATGRAIRVESTATGTMNVTLTNNAGATIQSNDDAVQVQSGGTFASGSVFSVVNRGTIQSNGGAGVGGQGLDLTGVVGTGVKAQVDNYGTIRGTFNDGVRFGGEGHLHNYAGGVINGGSATAYAGNVDGVTFLDNASGDVINDADADISGDRHGINAGVGTNITVTNSGTITGRNGSGVGSDGSATVINYGTITGSFSNSAGSDTHGSTVGAVDGGGPDGINDGDGDGIDIDFLANIENFGLIQGTGAGGNGSDGLPNTSEGIAAGGGTITNHVGATIRGLGLGILIDDSSQGNAPFVTHVINDGTIEGTNSYGIKIVSNLDDTIVNSGTISGGDGVAILFGSGANTLSILDGSTITGVSDGGAGNDTLDYSDFGSGVTVDLGAGTATGTGGVVNFEAVTGSDFADTLTGAAGASTLAGGAGDDVYYVNAANTTVVESAGDAAGVDTIYATVDLVLADNVEIGRVGDTTIGLSLTGNALANALYGGAGADSLIGGAGADTLTGGDGNDSYYVDAADTIVEGSGASSGYDTVYTGVDFVLGDNLEAISVYGTLNGLSLTGNGLANTFHGGAGADTLIGGAGNDIYYVGAGDTVVEDAAGGVDTVYTTVDFALADNVEIGRVGDTASGVALTGNGLDNSLFGGAGADTLIGGAGNDRYFIGAGDTVVEDAAGGVDSVYTSADYTLSDNVEAAYVYGTSAGLTLTGNGLANSLFGGAGSDTLVGGAGNDRYFVGVGDVVVEASDASGGVDTVYTNVDFTLSDGVETISVFGTTAGLALTGNDLANSLFGGAGADTLTGGAGNDRYYVGVGDTVVEAADASGGVDTVYTSADFTASEGIETLRVFGTTSGLALTGNDLANSLFGGDGADTLAGGDGNDRYFVGAGDTVIETAGASGGVDTVYTGVDYTLSAGVEMIRVFGTTTGLALTGNDLANSLYGGDGADTLSGGAGADKYFVGAGDTVVEAADGGKDTVFASADFTLGDNVENLRAYGTTAGLHLTGNDGANGIIGGAGADTIAGGGGIDVLTGGAGADTFDFSALADSAVAAYDRITDFASGVDHIDLTGLEASTGQQLSWIGDAAFSGVAGELHAISRGALTLVEADIDGNGKADFRIALTNGVAVAKHDFIL